MVIRGEATYMARPELNPGLFSFVVNDVERITAVEFS